MAGRSVQTESRDSRGASSRSQTPAIQVLDLAKVYGSRRVLDGLSFDVGWGKVTGFLGPNGAGKTTTLRSVLGLVEPSSGSTAVLGRSYRELREPIRLVGAVLETTNFNPKRTARAHLQSLATAARLSRSRIEEVLDTTGLTEAADRKVGSYSLGMRQRLGLAAALLGGPRVLILDEPANGLDPHGIRWLRGELQSYAASGNAVLVSSHLLSEVAELADEVVVIDRGRLVAQGSVSELTQGELDLEEAYFKLLDREEG